VALFDSEVFDSALFDTGGGAPTPDPNGCNILLQSGYKITKESGDGSLLLTNCVIPIGVDGCYILFQDGGRIIKQSGDGFLLLENCNLENQPSGGIDAVTWQPDFRALQAEKEARRAFREKQNEIVELKLEAQDLILRKAELQKERTKQAERQLKALQLEYDNLQKETARQLILLQKLEQIAIKRKKTVVLLLLMAVNPLSSLAIN